MYLEKYKLTEKPFQITTDSRFLWLGEKHKEAFATLKYGVLDNKGFLLLTGDVGTGKTTLINALIKSIGSEVILAKIPDPRLDELDFFRFVADAFRIKNSINSKGEFLIIFQKFLEKAYASGKQVLLIIDEAQRLQPDLLEEIRHLSNIEKEHVKLLNIFFVGQVEFNSIILGEENRAIRQRITVNYSLERLSEEETGAYIRHRLKVAGNDKEIFQQDAVREVYNFSQGAPRLINILCDRALLTGFVENKKKIDLDIILECAEELQIQPHVDDKKNKVKQAQEPPLQAAPLQDELQNSEIKAETGQEIEDIEFDLSDIRKRKGSMWGIYTIFFFLLILIGVLCAYFFYLPA